MFALLENYCLSILWRGILERILNFHSNAGHHGVFERLNV